MPSVEEKFVDQVITESAMCNNSDSRRLIHHIARDIVFYGYLLQDVTGRAMLDRLLGLVGTDNQDVLHAALLSVQGFMKDRGTNSVGQDWFVFSDKMMEVIYSRFMEDSSNGVYRLNALLPYTQVTGFDFVMAMNEMPKQAPDFCAQVVAQSLSGILGARVYQPRSDAYPEFFIIEGRQPDPSVPDHSFILAVITSTATISGDFSHVLQGKAILNGLVAGMQTMLLCVPSVTGQVAQFVNDDRSTFCMWELSMVHYLHLLANALNTEELKAKARENLGALFVPVNNSYAYCELQSVESIQRRVADA